MRKYGLSVQRQPDKKLEIAKSIIDKADHFGVKLSNLHIDPCVMALATAAAYRTSESSAGTDDGRIS